MCIELGKEGGGQEEELLPRPPAVMSLVALYPRRQRSPGPFRQQRSNKEAVLTALLQVLAQAHAEGVPEPCSTYTCPVPEVLRQVLLYVLQRRFSEHDR